MIARDHELDRNQDHDNDLQAQGAPGVDDVGEHLGGLGDDGQLAGQGFGAFLQLVFVLQPGIEPLQVMSIPYDVRLFSDRDTA